MKISRKSWLYQLIQLDQVMSAAGDTYDREDDLYIGPYGKLRLSLLNHMIDYYKDCTR